MAALTLPNFAAAGVPYFADYFMGKPVGLTWAEVLEPSALVGRMKALLFLAKSEPAVRDAFYRKGVFSLALFARDLPVDDTQTGRMIEGRVAGADAVTVAMLDWLRGQDNLIDYVGGDVLAVAAVSFALEKRSAKVVIALLRLLQAGAIPEFWWSSSIIEEGLDKLAAVLPDRRYFDASTVASLNKGVLEAKARLSLLRADKAAKTLVLANDGTLKPAAKKKATSLLDYPIALGAAVGIFALVLRPRL